MMGSLSCGERAVSRSPPEKTCRRSRSDLQNPNFAAMAEAAGVRGIRIEKPDEVNSAIAAGLAHDGRVLVDAVVARTELAMPPAITEREDDELIELAQANLWR
jgi:pyruvate dehydrogenase (quinone)